MRGQKELSPFFLDFPFLIFVELFFVRTFFPFFFFAISFLVRRRRRTRRRRRICVGLGRCCCDGDARGGERHTSTGCKGPKVGLGQASK